jgi:transposase InsO family protein
MTITMDDSQIKTLDQIRGILKSSQGLEFKGLTRDGKYGWMEGILTRFKYFSLGKKAKGLVKTYLHRMTGLSRAQLTRLVCRKLKAGSINASIGKRNCFERRYTDSDKELLVETDNAHGRLSGPATRRIFERQYGVYGDKRFERLRSISPAHIYNLRSSRTYKLKAQTFASTRSVQVSIGIRRKPEAMGRPGWIRVDTVHQGDLNGEKGVYHVNLVDSVLQWEIVLCVEKISESYLVPALEGALLMFPFLILGFHSDNGGEYINAVVSKLLNKLLIEQTKSRSGRTNDNALVEGKNGSVIRKHMGYWHMEQRYAPKINEFYREHFNGYLNFHRPCGFATVTVDAKGKRRKKYQTYQTPYERLKSLKDAGQYLREGITLEMLDKAAGLKTDNESAEGMQEAKDKLFNRLGRTKKRRINSLQTSIQTQKGGRIHKTTTTLPRSISGSSLD